MFFGGFCIPYIITDKLMMAATFLAILLGIVFLNIGSENHGGKEKEKEK